MEPVAGSDWAVYHDRSFRVARVVDGDTLDIEVPDHGKPVTRIRLWGVDTPETGHGRMPLMHFGPEAKAFAQQTLEGRRVHVVLSPKKSRGKYGRLLAYVFLERGGRMFNEMLLREGFAYADLRFKHHYDDRFQSIEKLARRANIGLWAEITPEQMPAWKQRFEERSK
jgi:micrococcal nuclease